MTNTHSAASGFRSIQTPSLGHPERGVRKAWSLDVAQLTAGFVVFAFPIAALLSSLVPNLGDMLTIGSRFLTFGLAVLLLFYRGGGGKLSLPILWPFAFLLIYSARLAADLVQGNNRDNVMIAIQYFLLTIVTPAGALALVRQRDWDEAKFVKLLLGIGTIFIALVGWNYLIGNARILGGLGDETVLGFEGARLGFERINPILVGHAAVSVMLACVVAQFSQSGRSLKIIAILIGGCSAVIMTLAASRGPILALAGASVFLLLVNGKAWWLFGFGILAAVLGTAFSVFDLQFILQMTRLSEIGRDSNSLSRFDLASEAFEAFLAKPIFGSGMELPISGGWPHNVFAEVLMSTGLLGAPVFVVMLYKTLRRAYMTCKIQVTFSSLLLVQSLIALQFSGSIWGTAMFWASIVMVNAGLGEKHLPVNAPIGMMFHYKRFKT